MFKLDAINERNLNVESVELLIEIVNSELDRNKRKLEKAENKVSKCKRNINRTIDLLHTLKNMESDIQREHFNV